MATPSWQPGKLYPPGSLVVPQTAPPIGPVQVANGGFDSDATGWGLIAVGTSAAISWVAAGGYQSPGCIQYQGATSNAEGSITSTGTYPVAPGQSINASAYARMTGGSGPSGFRVVLEWYDASNTLISVSGLAGTPTVLTNGGGWRQSSVSGSAPAGAATVRLGVYTTAADVPSVTTMLVDNIAWNYNSPQASSLQYRAVQPAAGYSANVEPAWPPILGQQVVDNEVIWEAVSVSRVVWEARPILKSGATEPDWPLEHGAFVPDGTISWQAVDLRITDENCPNSKVVMIAKSKIYAGAKDIVRYSATLNPRDWTSERDAGYLGTGLQQNGANDVAVLNLYRGNAVVMNATTFQQWNIDPDPALMDLLDTMEGIGSIWHLAAQPVANDLFYLASLGVRTIGLSGATNNLKSGDVGLPVDPLIQELAREAQANGGQPLGMYYPSSGQYWLIFNRIAFNDGSGVSPVEVCPSLDVGDRYAEVFVYTLSQIGQVGAWTRFLFPFAIDYAAQQGDDLYVRDGDTVFRLSELIGACDFYVPGSDGDPLVAPAGVPFEGIIWWPHLDMGSPGQDKTMESVDVVGYGNLRIEVGYNQRDVLALTTPYNVIADTLDGTPVPLTLTAPTMSFRLTYPGWSPLDSSTDAQRFWEFNAMGVNVT